MKKRIFLAVFTAALLAAGCHKLMDTDPTTFYTQDSFWKNGAQAQEGLTGCYQVLLSFYDGATPFLFETMSPNAYNYNNTSSANTFALGTQTATTTGINSSYWTWAYRGIGRCNTVLDKVPGIEMDETLKNRIIAEAKFLRAFFYDKINVLFGGVPLILETPDIHAHAHTPRSSSEEVLSQILRDLDEAAPVLPASYPANEAGRATKGAALALKARILLQNHRYEEVISAIETLEGLGRYSLYPNYQGLFKKENEGNAEVIFDIRFKGPEIVNGYDIIMAQYNTQAPLQGLVDAYRMTDGKTTSESELYNPEQPYENRDPRFKQTILYLGAPWRNRTATAVDLHQTGYTFRKFTKYNEATAGTIPAAQSDVSYIEIRYADVLLMYAEAINELRGPTTEVYTAANAVRQRPTVNMPPLPAGLDKAGMQQAIRLERRIELAGEGSYFYDIRRWKTIEQEMNASIRDYAGRVIETRSFNPARDYFWPVPFDEIDLNPELEQNPNY